MQPKKLMPIGLVLLAAGVLVGATAPAAPAQTTLYEMFGQGNMVRSAGPGMPFCPLDCSNPSWEYTFETLPITGIGVLLDQEVNGTYDCPSRIPGSGNTSNFVIDWQFSCNRTTGVGPSIIAGHFTNAANPGLPLFRGSFSTPGGNPGEVGSICTGVPVPTQMDGTHIAAAFFWGECTAISGVT